MIHLEHPVVQSDLQQLVNSGVDWPQLDGKTVLITGATGMLASYLAFMLLHLNAHHGYHIKLLLLARSGDKLEKVYGTASANTVFLEQDVCEPIRYAGDVHYIIHAAGGASTQSILTGPVGIIRANTVGTMQVLDLAKAASARKTIFLSTREVYGQIDNRAMIAETDSGSLDPLDERSCYPESKRAAEALLRAYASQYNVPFNTLRIAHAYGPGMAIVNDGRVLADFMNDAVRCRDIRMNSTGEPVRAFCYITDAVDGIYRVMLSGAENEAYNLGNETEPVAVVDLARRLQAIAGNSKTVQTAERTANNKGYTTYKRVPLNTGKLEGLGWRPRVSLAEGLQRTLRSFVDQV